jgi:hypothetical protein
MSRNPLYDRPWTVGQYTYQTDGRIIVRVPAKPEYGPMDKTDAIAAWIDKWLADGAGDVMVPVPTVMLPDQNVTRCEDCDGRGFEHDCRDCSCECSACDGDGEITLRIGVKFGEVVIFWKYWRQIAALPNARLSCVENANGHLAFAFDGGAGITSRMRDVGGEDLIVSAESEPVRVAMVRRQG